MKFLHFNPNLNNGIKATLLSVAKKRSHSSGTGTIFHPYKTDRKDVVTNKRDESHIGQYNTFRFFRILK